MELPFTKKNTDTHLDIEPVKEYKEIVNLSGNEDVSIQLTSIQNSITSFRTLFEEQSLILSNKEQLISQLFEKIQKYEDDYAYNKFQKGVILDIISLIDSIEQMAKLAHNSKVDSFIDSMRIIHSQLIKTLLKCGVERLNEKSGVFNEFFQRAIDVVSTDNPDQDNIVNQTVRAGYKKSDGVVIRPQDVVISKFLETKMGE